MKYFIKTFGCAANEADSERIASYYQARGYKPALSINDAAAVVINTCMVRQSAEDRAYGLVRNLTERKRHGKRFKIIITGCMVGMAARESTGKMLTLLRQKMPGVDEFLPIEEVGFDYAQVRSDKAHALVPISNGCNNFCTFCVVPFTRGREVSRPFTAVVSACRELAGHGYTHITLVGQNVNSYGADLVKQGKGESFKHNGQSIRPVFVKHLGRWRIPTLFPHLLEEICKIGDIKKIDFISSNPWDFSDELIETIARNPKISRHIHLPVQSGDTEILKKMNRWYSPEEYLNLVRKLRRRVRGVTLSTDIIVGFCGETEAQFQNTVSLAKAIGFTKAYVSIYSSRPMTAADKAYQDNVAYAEKKRRWEILEELINKTNLRRGTYTINE